MSWFAHDLAYVTHGLMPHMNKSPVQCHKALRLYISGRETWSWAYVVLCIVKLDEILFLNKSHAYTIIVYSSADQRILYCVCCKPVFDCYMRLLNAVRIKWCYSETIHALRMNQTFWKLCSSCWCMACQIDIAHFLFGRWTLSSSLFLFGHAPLTWWWCCWSATWLASDHQVGNTDSLL